MEKSERIIRTIIGAEKANTHALALSVEVMADLLFRQKIPMDDIYVGSDVYPVVAKRSGKSLTAATRQIERTANLCLDALHSPLAKQYIGRTISAPANAAHADYLSGVLRPFRQAFFRGHPGASLAPLLSLPIPAAYLT